MKRRIAVLFWKNRRSVRTREGLLEKVMMRKEAMERESCATTTGEKGWAAGTKAQRRDVPILSGDSQGHREEHERGQNAGK